MAHNNRLRSSTPRKAAGSGEEEVEKVLAALQDLLERVSSPPLRECLEAVRSDIALLARRDDEPQPVSSR